MSTFPYRKLNAFTHGASSGNPAACLYLQNLQDLTPDQMLAIAKEHRGFVSEVVFCAPLGGHAFALRYYSAEREVDFCGHGTIACMADLLQSTPALHALPEVAIDTPRGRLTVYNALETLNAVFITAPEPEIRSTDVDAALAAQALGLTPGALHPAHPVELINAGLNTLIVPVTTLRAELSLQPDEPALKAFCTAHGLDIVLVFTFDVSSKKNFVRTRVFAPRFGYLEDPATGSGNSALGYYLLRHALWDGQPIQLEQNAEPAAYNVVHLKTQSGRVLFGGNATVKIRGEYDLES